MKAAKRSLALVLVMFSVLLGCCSSRHAPSPTTANANSTLPATTKDGLPSQRHSEPAAPSLRVEPERLIDIIKQLQMEYVGESFGSESGQCFTEVDLNKFTRENKTSEIVEKLKKDKDFAALVSAIKDLKPGERSILLDRARKTYKKTWLELRLDPRTTSADELRKGQTVHGQRAEKSIAQAVVELVSGMI